MLSIKGEPLLKKQKESGLSPWDFIVHFKLNIKELVDKASSLKEISFLFESISNLKKNRDYSKTIWHTDKLFPVITEYDDLCFKLFEKGIKLVTSKKNSEKLCSDFSSGINWGSLGLLDFPLIYFDTDNRSEKIAKFIEQLEKLNKSFIEQIKQHQILELENKITIDEIEGQLLTIESQDLISQFYPRLDKLYFSQITTVKTNFKGLEELALRISRFYHTIDPKSCYFNKNKGCYQPQSYCDFQSYGKLPTIVTAAKKTADLELSNHYCKKISRIKTLQKLNFFRINHWYLLDPKNTAQAINKRNYSRKLKELAKKEIPSITTIEEINNVYQLISQTNIKAWGEWKKCKKSIIYMLYDQCSDFFTTPTEFKNQYLSFDFSPISLKFLEKWEEASITKAQEADITDIISGYPRVMENFIGLGAKILQGRYYRQFK